MRVIEVVSTQRLTDGTTVQLSRVVRDGSVGVMAAGSAHAGCQYTAYNFLGWVIYSFTTWQDFNYDGRNITSFPDPATSSVAYWGWSLTSSSASHWWVTNPTTASARGNYTFTQYVGGQPYQSHSGYTQVNISGNGTWSCTAS